jgi:homoserine dehydrogenase
VPGFAALKDGRTVLLGRGGSDLSAVFFASALGLRTATLVKDVDGVYDRDPAQAGAAAHRFEALSYDEAARVAGKLVQPRAIRFAQAQGVAIHVRRLGEDRATRIGA